jgi:y4mF family transcriptional regulator
VVLIINKTVYLQYKWYKMKEKNLNDISKYVKKRRKQSGITQPEMAMKAGVGLRFVRDLEQGKNTMRMDKVNDVLRLFGETLGVVPLDREKLINNA